MTSADSDKRIHQPDLGKDPSAAEREALHLVILTLSPLRQSRPAADGIPDDDAEPEVVCRSLDLIGREREDAVFA